MATENVVKVNIQIVRIKMVSMNKIKLKFTEIQINIYVNKNNYNNRIGIRIIYEFTM